MASCTNYVRFEWNKHSKCNIQYRDMKSSIYYLGCIDVIHFYSLHFWLVANCFTCLQLSTHINTYTTHLYNTLYIRYIHFFFDSSVKSSLLCCRKVCWHKCIGLNDFWCVSLNRCTWIVHLEIQCSFQKIPFHLAINVNCFFYVVFGIYFAYSKYRSTLLIVIVPP